jgi:hypothetical protein
LGRPLMRILCSPFLKAPKKVFAKEGGGGLARKRSRTLHKSVNGRVTAGAEEVAQACRAVDKERE